MNHSPFVLPARFSVLTNLLSWLYALHLYQIFPLSFLLPASYYNVYAHNDNLLRHPQKFSKCGRLYNNITAQYFSAKFAEKSTKIYLIKRNQCSILFCRNIIFYQFRWVSPVICYFVIIYFIIINTV